MRLAKVAIIMTFIGVAPSVTTVLEVHILAVLVAQLVASVFVTGVVLAV